jgi:hypothetical protein
VIPVLSFTEHGAGTALSATRSGGGGAVPLPCLSSNNSTEGEGGRVNLLTGGHKRSAFVLAFEIMALAKIYGIEKLGFLTLTFADLVLDLKEANRRFDSLNTHVIKERYTRGVVVPERQKSGRVHFHLVTVLAADIRSGCDFGAFGRGDYRSANPALRAEWAFWRVTSPRYGFGRHELLPVKSCAEGIARYVGKYISKHVRERAEADKGARLVRYLGYKEGGRKASCRFGWNTDNGWLWRHKLGAFASRNGAKSTEDLAKLFGPRWAYRLQAEILAEKVDACHPSMKCAEKSFGLMANAQAARVIARGNYEEGKTFARTITLDRKKVWTKNTQVT